MGKLDLNDFSSLSVIRIKNISVGKLPHLVPQNVCKFSETKFNNKLLLLDTLEDKIKVLNTVKKKRQ